MGNEIEYEDFEVEISPCQHKELEVRVLRSTFDRPRARFVSPYGPKETHKLLTDLEDQVCRSSESLRDLVVELSKGAKTTAERPEEVGRKLFESLFRDDVKETFGRCVSRLYGNEKGNRSLRIRLSFGNADGDGAELAALPWELLYNPRDRGFLALDSRTLVVRYIDAARPTIIPPVKPPVRVLAVMPMPEGEFPLDLEYERRRIKDALVETIIDLEILEPPTTLERLRARLRGRGLPYHVLHFMGHGRFENGKGKLIFEDEAGRPKPVSGRDLVYQLSEGLAFLRLMVINACSGAKMNRYRGQDPFTSVAAELAKAGLPAVVAMQFPISDTAATWFSAAFYDAVGKGQAVDTAVVEGRLAVHLNSHTSLEWATPVLFLRMPDGRIVDTSEVKPEEPLRVGIISFLGWGKEIAELGKSHYLLDLTDAFEGRSIREWDLWTNNIVPRVATFMARAFQEGHRHRLEMPAHSSVAFTAGYYLEAKSGFHLKIRQRGPRGTEDWHMREGEVPDQPLWVTEERKIEGETRDIALAIAISRRVLKDVDNYLEQANLPLRKLLVAVPAGGTANDGILSGAHAYRMAQELINWIEDQERPETLHLFVSGPNAFVFYLGQLSRNFGVIQLYEHDFGGTGAYTPSIRLGRETTG